MTEFYQFAGEHPFLTFLLICVLAQAPISIIQVWRHR